MAISAWWLFPAAIPVLYLGELIVRRVALLRQFSIPVPVVGGLLVAFLILGFNLAGGNLSIGGDVTQKWAMWFTTPDTILSDRKAMGITQPLATAFFTCIGLNASWLMARKGGLPLLIFLGISIALAVSQNFVGVGLCKLLGENPLLGVLCGGVALTGGPATTMGMADDFTHAGVHGAKVVGLAAATFGLVGGSLMGGPIATMLIQWKKLKTPGSSLGSTQAGVGGVLPPPTEGEVAQVLEGKLPGETPAEKQATATAAGDGEGFGLAPQGFIGEVLALGRFGKTLLIHIVIVLACLKAGSYLSHFLGGIQIGSQRLTFPIYMGAMLLGILFRNILDFARPNKESLIKTDVVEGLGSIILAVFLAMTMVSLNLLNLKSVAGSLAILLAAQAVLMMAFAIFVTFPVMGRDYDAAVLTAGQIGFGFGATNNAVATMEATTRRWGPSPRSFLIVTIVGGFLVDIPNMFMTMGFLHWFKPMP